MWKILAISLQEMVRMNVIQHKILDNSYYIDFFAVKVKVIIIDIYLYQNMFISRIAKILENSMASRGKSKS